MLKLVQLSVRMMRKIKFFDEGDRSMIALRLQITNNMGCSVTKQEAKQQKKDQFAFDQTRQVKSETVNKKQAFFSELPDKMSLYEPSNIEIDIQKFIVKKQKQQPQLKLKQNSIVITVKQAPHPPTSIPSEPTPQRRQSKKPDPSEVDGTQYQPYRAVRVPSIRGITKQAMPQFIPTQSCSYERSTLKRGQISISLFKSGSRLGTSVEKLPVS